jgi:ParB family chromosome partitioning protein
LLTALPVDKVVPTPFQRDISDAHVRRLTQAMDKTKRFLDPIIAVREQTGDGAAYWTPNGYHRLTALKELGAKTVLALLVPERAVAYQILALNIEKAHNLREKAIGVRRMYATCARSDGDEESYALEFEEPALATLGFAYEERGRAVGRRLPPILRKADAGCRGSCGTRRERGASARAAARVRRGGHGAIAALKARGLQQPVPAQLRRRAHQPAALHQGRAAAARGAAAVDDQARGTAWTSARSRTRTWRARAARPRRARTEELHSAARR